LVHLSDRKSIEKYQSAFLKEMNMPNDSLKYSKILLLINSMSKNLSQSKIESFFFSKITIKKKISILNDLIENIIEHNLLKDTSNLNSLSNIVSPEILSILNSFLMCMTWLVSYSLVHEFNNNNDNVAFEVIFCIGLVIHGHFIFLFHIYFCKSKKSLLFQNNAKHKLNTLLNLVNNKNEKDKISGLKYRSQNVFTIPLQMDNFTIKPRPTIMTCYDTNSNNANFQSFDSNINSLSYLYTNSNKNRIKKKFLSSKSSLASSLSFLSNKRKQLCNRFYKKRNRIDENINKRYLGTYNNTNNNNNDVPSRINRLNDSFKRIKYKTRKSKLIQNPFDFSSIISQSNSSPSQNNSPISSRMNNERTLFIKSNSFKLTHHLPDSLFLK
jgi:hypothetical protein